MQYPQIIVECMQKPEWYEYYEINCNKCYGSQQKQEEQYQKMRQIHWITEDQTIYEVKQIDLNGFCLFEGSYKAINDPPNDKFIKQFPHWIWWMKSIITSTELYSMILELEVEEYKSTLNKLILDVNTALRPYNNKPEQVNKNINNILEAINYDYNNFIGDLIANLLLRDNLPWLPKKLRYVESVEIDNIWMWRELDAIESEKESVYLWKVRSVQGDDHYNVLTKVINT